MPTAEQCRAYAAEHKILGANPTNSARRTSVHANISRSGRLWRTSLMALRTS